MAGQQTRGSRTAGNAISDGRELASDRRARRAASSAADAPFKAAYDAGRRGDPPDEHRSSDAVAAAYQDGVRAARTEARAARLEQLRGSAGSTASDGAGFLLGLVGYALLVNYLRGGVPQVRAWLAAKFLNRTSSGHGPARPAAPTGPGANTASATAPTGNTARPAAPQPAQAIRVGV